MLALHGFHTVSLPCHDLSRVVSMIDRQLDVRLGLGKVLVAYLLLGVVPFSH